MGALQVKNVPPGLHEAARRRAAEEGLTVSEYILTLVQRDLALPSQRRWLAELGMREPVMQADVTGVLDAARSERDASLTES